MSASAKVEILSARELEIANAYSGGASYREIAERLFIAPATVRTHLSTIYRKLGVSSKIELLNALSQGARSAPADATQPAQAHLVEDADMSRVLSAKPRVREFDLPPLPSIAVLPFINLSPEPEQAFFAYGLAEDITTRLGYLRGLIVASRAASFAFRTRPDRIQDTANALGVANLLDGSVRTSGNRVRVTAQLIDGAHGTQLWAQRYDRDLTDIFAIQDEITQAIVGAMRVELTDGEASAVGHSEALDLEAWEAFHRGVQAFLVYTPEAMIRARGHFETALKRDPDNLDARIYLAWCHWQDSHSMFSPDPDAQLAKAREQVDMIRDSGQVSASVLHLEAATLTLEHRYDEALEVSERAVALGRCHVFGMTPACLVTSFSGDLEGGLDLLRTTIRQMPSTPNDTVWWLGLILCLLGDLENAIVAAEEYARRAPNDQHSYTLTALVHGFAGRNDHAREEVRKLRALYPKYNIAQFRHHEAFRDERIVDRMAAVLRNAGLPE